MSEGKNGDNRAPISGWALFAALGVLLAFTIFVYYMITAVGADEITWTRMAWLFSSVEAIAFGAAGALFGSSIQRQRAERAEESAEKNQQAAANGKALAAVLKAEGLETPSDEGPLEALGPGSPRDTGGPVAARHAALARELFPDE